LIRGGGIFEEFLDIEITVERERYPGVV
jgi:hypothetical protein